MIKRSDRLETARCLIANNHVRQGIQAAQIAIGAEMRVGLSALLVSLSNGAVFQGFSVIPDVQAAAALGLGDVWGNQSATQMISHSSSTG